MLEWLRKTIYLNEGSRYRGRDLTACLPDSIQERYNLSQLANSVFPVVLCEQRPRVGPNSHSKKPIYKLKLPLCLIKHHAMKTWRYRSPTLTSALDGGQLPASGPGYFNPMKESPVPTRQKAGWAPKPVWTTRSRGNFLSLPEIDPRPPNP
jgi:hypothetical protein